MIIVITSFFYFFFFNDTATTEIYTLSLHDALPISPTKLVTLGDEVEVMVLEIDEDKRRISLGRSEEHTSELQSPCNLVCRLLLEKKKKPRDYHAVEISELHDSVRGDDDASLTCPFD